MGELQQRHHDDGGSPSPLQFPFPLQLDPYFLHRFSLLVFITVNGVGAVRALAMFWCVCACQKLPFPKKHATGKTEWCVEDDEEVIEKALYMGPVAGRVTTCRKAKYLFSVPPARGSSRAVFFAGAKIQDDSSCGLQFDVEFSNPNPGSKAFHGSEAGPDAHGFAPRAQGRKRPANPSCTRRPI